MNYETAHSFGFCTTCQALQQIEGDKCIDCKEDTVVSLARASDIINDYFRLDAEVKELTKELSEGLDGGC